MAKAGKVHFIDHPLIQHKLTLLRDKNTSSKDFRELLHEISMLMAFEVTRDLPAKTVQVLTPLERTKGKQISAKSVAVVAILRAGLGMIGGILELIPKASVGHIGLYRDEKSLQALQYYQKLPQDIAQRFAILADPMLATGHSAVKGLHILKDLGVKKMVLVSLIAAPEGIKEVRRAHPEVKIFVANIDDRLNSHGYIVPGLGDAGDRLFGTK